jgi:glycosyltransferase involved in cell wall biosynthesis
VIRTGFVLNVSEHLWLGGQVYFRNLFGALAALPERRVMPVALTGGGAPASLTKDLTSVEQTRLTCLKRGTPQWLVRRLLARVSTRDVILERDLLRAGIDLLSHSGHLGRKARVATLAWIPDFQHLHMPAFFSSAEVDRRNVHLSEMCRCATRVIVSSVCAQNDLLNFCKEAQGKVRVLQFVADMKDPNTLPGREVLEQKYGFSGPYFFLPNQFWVHKNHRVVLDALSILRSRGRPARVIASGRTLDDRNPGHFGQLMQHARSLNVDAEFNVLGLIPRDDVMALTWHALAVINPSRFEGWSTTVEEAKSMGVRVLLSDIAVHREQAPPDGAYFHPDDPERLAQLMEKVQRGNDREQRRLLSEDAQKRLPGRRTAFARLYEDYALECVGAHAAGEHP